MENVNSRKQNVNSNYAFRTWFNGESIFFYYCITTARARVDCRGLHLVEIEFVRSCGMRIAHP